MERDQVHGDQVNDGRRGPVEASTGFALRPARADDVPVLARVWRDGWHDGHEGNVPDELVKHRTLEEFERRISDRVPSTTVAVITAADGDPIAGFVVVIDDEVEQLYVASPARGTAIASHLLTAAEQVIFQHHERAWLAVVAGNVRARRFYERCGWRDFDAFDTLAEISEGVMAVPALRYEKRRPILSS